MTQDSRPAKRAGAGTVVAGGVMWFAHRVWPKVEISPEAAVFAGGAIATVIGFLTRYGLRGALRALLDGWNGKP